MADWKLISGGLSAISAGFRTNAWGVNSGGGIYRYTNNDTSPWVNIPGGLSDIGAGADGTARGVNAGNEIFRYTGDQPS
jgi:virginiamycin B lyase